MYIITCFRTQRGEIRNVLYNREWVHCWAVVVGLGIGSLGSHDEEGI